MRENFKNDFEIQVLELEDGVSEILVLDGDVIQTASADENQTIGALVSADEEKLEETTSSLIVDDGKYDSGFEKLSENATFAERLAYGGKVAAIGMITVFLVLVIIWALCSVMGKVIGAVGKNSKESDEPQKAHGNTQSATPATSAPATNAVDYSAIAVVASAAIAAYRGEDTVSFEISSIRPCVNGAVALAPEVVAQIAASIACLEGKDQIDFTISSIRII